MGSKYLISVIIPVHNTALYLKKCVESVRNQTLKNIEIILVENLSDDESPQICDEYAKIDERIKVLHLATAGPSVARNAGIEIATAPYIGFIDSDDYIDSEMYEVMLNSMFNNSTNVAYCNFCLEYENGLKKYIYSDSGAISVRSSIDVQRDIICEKVSSSPCTKIFAKSLFDLYNFPTGVFYEDHATIYRWIGEYDKIVWIDRPFYHYIQRNCSTCHTISAEKIYHYFIAEYPRLSFVKEHFLFSGQKLNEVVNLIVGNCLRSFNICLESADSNQYPAFIEDMRSKIRKLLALPKVELDSKNYKRIRKITYFWWLYYWTHSSKKYQ